MSHYCSNCNIDLGSEDSFKTHYKTEFHKYNIKRKMLNLGPIAEEVYLKKYELQSAALKDAFHSNQSIHFCKLCNKSFNTDKTYEQHLQSQKHKDSLKQSLRQGEQVQSDKLSQVSKCSLESPTICLFCDTEQEDIESCIKHMQIAHGFFIREPDCLINPAGLLKALSEQINKNQVCLHCYAGFSSAQGVKQHMMDRGHCFMPQQQYKMLSVYYDFEKKLQALIDEQRQAIAIDAQKPGALQKAEQQVETTGQEEEEDDDDNEDNWDDDEDETNIEKGSTAAEIKKRLNQQLKELKQYKATLLKSGEMQLPNGKIIGHRYLRKYYRQNHIPFPDPKLNMIEEAKQEFAYNDDKFLVLYDEAYFAKFLRKHNFQLSQRTQHGRLHIGMQNNKITRKHFRASC